MDEDLKQNVDTSSFAFKNGIEAGLNSVEDTKNWQAGNELGQELKDDAEAKEPIATPHFSEDSVPLFLKDGADDSKGTAQDEKDEGEE
jgi:hypothetical protein